MVEDLLSDEALRLLRAVAEDDTRFTDRPLSWLPFVVRARRDQAELDHDSLKSWLLERGWPQVYAERRAAEYDFGRILLKAYDESLGRRQAS